MTFCRVRKSEGGYGRGVGGLFRSSTYQLTLHPGSINFFSGINLFNFPRPINFFSGINLIKYPQLINSRYLINFFIFSWPIKFNSFLYRELNSLLNLIQGGRPECPSR